MLYDRGRILFLSGALPPGCHGVAGELFYQLDLERCLYDARFRKAEQYHSEPEASGWAEAMVQQRGPIGTRVLHGLLSLAGKHPVAALEAAAEKALHHGTWRLRDLRTLLERAGPTPQLDFLETHPLIRSLDAYEALTPDCFNPQPKTVYEPT